ncbi:hypothetical protein E4U21_006477 [Claviceps maximensis]|nr:hypothetical protein E4U21_006477 [Claviceps maximensis]
MASHWEDLDSDDIGSVVSEDLYENRPNRWRGTKSTWRDLTAEERMLWRSMLQVVDRDLAVHLYDAFALKRRDLDPKTAEGLTVKTDDGHNAIWAPPKIWTAWPLQEKLVPREGLFRETKGEDEALTLRRTEKTLPSTDLQEELGATILRMAKQRFRRREQRRRRQQQQQQQQLQQKKRRIGSYSMQPSIEIPSSPVPPRIEESEDEYLLPSSPPGMGESGSDNDGKSKVSWPSDDDIDDGCGDDEDEGRDNDSVAADTKRTARDYEPAISTDDQLSQQLLRPSIRHILTQLDRTLTVLHNSRVAGLSYLFDSSDSSPEGDSDAATPGRKRGRPRRRENSKSAPSSEAEAVAASPRRRRGRPRKVHEPQEGETFEEMQVRLARQSHRRLPWTQKDNEAAVEGWQQRGTMRQGQTQRQQQEEQAPQSPCCSRSSASPSSQHANKERKLRRWGLRDWSDVLGAASLAGFPPSVIARATQRCASLFKQGMTMRTLDEQPLSRPGVFTTDYGPEEATSMHRGSLLSSSTSSASALTSDSDEDDDEDDDEDPDDDNGDFDSSSENSRHAQPPDTLPIRRSRSGGRGGRGRGRTPRSSSPAAASRSRSQSQSQSRSRSRSRSSAGLFLCPLQTCHRAADGFSRRANLRRHMQLVHPWHREGDEDEDDSENEVVGAVHVDGFLKMIHPGRGWRAEDMLTRKRKRFYGTRGRGRGEDEEDDSE